MSDHNHNHDSHDSHQVQTSLDPTAPMRMIKACANPECDGYVSLPVGMKAKFNSRRYCGVACAHACKGKTRIATLEAAGWEPAQKTKTNRRWYQANPDKERAQRLVRHARAKGWLPTVGECAVCDTTGPVEYHHHAGYKGAAARRVVPLCVACHNDQHHAKRIPRRLEATGAVPSALAEDVAEMMQSAVSVRLEQASVSF